jgi:hypothetical protein
MDTTVIPCMEAAFVAALLPTVFPDTCFASTTPNSTTVTIRAISQLPDDLRLDAVECDPELMEDTANRCDAIEGEMIVFVDGSVEAVASDVETLRTNLKSMISDGTFDDACPGSVRVDWVDTIRVSEEIIGKPPTSSPTTSIVDGIPLLGDIPFTWVVIALIVATASSCCFFGYLMLARR